MKIYDFTVQNTYQILRTKAYIIIIRITNGIPKPPRNTKLATKRQICTYTPKPSIH